MNVLSAALLVLAPPQVKAPPLKDAFLAQDREYAEIAFSPDGKWLVAGASRAARILSVPGAADGDFKDLRTLSSYGRVDELLFDPAGLFLITRSRDQDASVWEAATGAAVKFVLEEEGAGLRGPPALPSGDRWLVLPDRKSGLRFWQMDGLLGRRRWIGEIGVRQVQGVILGRLTASAWAGSSRLLLGDEHGHLFRVPNTAFLAQQAGGPERVPLRTATNANVFRPHPGEITGLAPTADGKLCVSTGIDGKARLWAVESIPMGPRPRGAKGPEPRWEIPGLAAALGADGRVLAVADAEGVGVYHVATGTAVSWNPTRAAKGRIVRLAFSPDRRYLAAILCRCSDCAGGERVASIPSRRSLAGHGGALVIWK